MKLLIGLPCLNEEKSLLILLDKLKCYHHDMLVADNNSDDNSKDLAKQYCKVITVKNIGKGNVVRSIINYAKNKQYSHVLIMDSDCSYSPEDIPMLINQAYRNPQAMIVGKREFTNIPFLNKIGNILFNKLLNVKDACSGMRLFPIKSFQGLKSKGFEIEVEMTMHAKQNEICINEVPISYNSRMGVTKLKPIQDGLRIFYTILFVK